MENIKSEIHAKVRAAIKAKLMELGIYVDEELPDYIMVMVANKRTQAQMVDDLQLFLGSNTEHFTVWLLQVVQKLAEVANADNLAVKQPSEHESSELKRKSSTSSMDSEEHRKEKRRKLHDEKKSKKNIGDHEKETEQKKDADSSDSIDVDMNLKPSSEDSAIVPSQSKESLVSSSVDVLADSCSPSVQKSSVKRTPEEVGDNDLKKSAGKSAVVSSSSSHLDSELVDNSDRTLTSGEQEIKETPIIEPPNAKTSPPPKVTSTISQGSAALTPTKDKIVLMHSDDEEDDEDFINIKADAEAEALLNEELPKESTLITPDPLTSPVTGHISNPVEKQISEKTKKVETVVTTSELEQLEIPVGTFDRKVPSGKDSGESETSNLSLSERFARKRKLEKELEVEDNPTAPVSRPAAPVLSIKDRLGVRKPIMADRLERPRPLRITDRLGQRAVTVEALTKKRMEPESSSSESSRSTSQSIEKVLRDRISRRVPEVTNSEQDNIQEQKKRPILSRVVLPQPGREEEEYDPANPAVGSVASVVRVKPRPRLPAELQANKNLLLKAVAEAQKSVASVPIRPEPSSPARRNLPDSVFARRAREGNIAITLPNRRAQAFNTTPKRDTGSERLVIPLKMDASHSRAKKILIQVSSDSNRSSSELTESVRLVGSTSNPRLNKCDASSEAEEELDHALEDEEEEEEDLLPDEGIVTEELENEDEVPAVYPPVGLASRMPRESRPQPQRSESPQFLVTLDGLDPSMFPSHSDGVDEDQCSPVKVEEEDNEQDDDDSSKISSTPSPPGKDKAKSVSPIVFTKRDNANEADNNLPKSLERCKYWPSCRLGTNCTFHHPNSPCKSFPKCPFREKCLYIHPKCKFDSSCTRRDCPFMHVALNTVFSSVSSVNNLRPRTPRSSQISSQVCKFFPRCSNALCRFLHPKPCRFGRFCNNKPDCNYLHDEVPPVDKLKWTSPFRT